MNTIVFSLLFCFLTANCAIYKTQDETLSRIVRSPHFTKSDSGDSSIVFRTQNWSGVARGANGAQGVFSGAAAAAGSAAPAADEAFSIAASGAAPVKDKLEERFGGSDHSDLHYIDFNPHQFYNPYIPDHHGDGRWGHGGYGHDFHRGFSGHQRGGYNYGQLNSGANNQAFAKSEASSNAASGCDTEQNSGQLSSNSFSKSQATSYPSTSGQSNGGYGSGSYANQGQLQSTSESKTFAQSESLSSGVQQAKPGNGFGNLQGLDYNGGQQAESHGNGFGSSQGLQNVGSQQVESSDSFSSARGFQNSDGQKFKNQGYSNGFGGDQSQKASYGFDQSGNGYRSQLSKGYELGTGSTNGNAQSNYNEHDISGVYGSRNAGGGLTGQGQKYAYGSSKYQAGIQSEGLQAGGVSGQSSDSDGSLINSANSNGQESLSSSSGSSAHEDLQSTLSGALGLASQGLSQASQNQPCSTCQKSGYAFSNAKSHSGSAVAVSIGG